MDNDDGGFSTYLLDLLTGMCPSSIPPRIITTVLFPAYTYDWVMLLIVLYDDAMSVRMTWYTDESSITTICDNVESVLYVGCDE